MCFLKLVYHFYIIKLKWKKYLKLKDDSLNGVEELPPRQYNPLIKHWLKIKQYSHEFKKKHFWVIKRFTDSKTLEHFLAMVVMGLCIGYMFTFLHFYNNVYRGDADIFWCFLVRLPLLVTITVSLAFTETGRCILCLLPLQLFSKRGQVYIHGTVLLLVTTGPLMNLKHNLNVIQDTSSCQQRGVADAAAEIADILFGPFSSFKQAAMEIVNGIKAMVVKLQTILGAFKRTVMAVADAIQNATRWINSKINGCKNTVGTTYQHCMDAFSWMYEECKVSVPSIFVKLCAVTEFASNLCSSVKPGEYLCDLVYFNVDPLVTTISQRISRLLDRAYTLMYFHVNIHHEFDVDSNSKSIVSQLKQKIESSLLSLTISSIFGSIFNASMFLFNFYFIWSVYRYRSLYLRRDEFDNYFITERLKEIDHKEALANKDSIFPLRRVERKKYINICTFRIVNKEWKNFSFPVLITIKTAVYLGIIGMDYLLFYITEKCRIFMLAVMQSFVSRTEVTIVGSGFLAELGRRVVRALNFMDYNFYQAHFMPCIPNPRPPNDWTNYIIYFWLTLLWFSWIFQPFALRLRHKVMDFYHPKTADRRARWLYNHITFKRITFVKLVAIKLRGKYGRDRTKLTFSIADLLRARFPWITHIIGKGLIGEECMICSHIIPPLFHCPTKDCLGIYCDDCYINIQGVCSLCREAMMLPEFKGKQKLFVDVDKDEEDIADIQDEAEGLFSVIDDDSMVTNLFYKYQGEKACQWDPVWVKEGSNLHEERTTEVYCYTFVDDQTLPKSSLKYKKLKPSARKTRLSYEETFEMF